VKLGVNLWSRVLIYNRPTRERERESYQPVDCVFFSFVEPQQTAVIFLIVRMMNLLAEALHVELKYRRWQADSQKVVFLGILAVCGDWTRILLLLDLVVRWHHSFPRLNK